MRFIRTTPKAATLLLAASPFALAGQSAHARPSLSEAPVYIAPMGTYMAPDTARDNAESESYGWQLTVGANVFRNFNLELRANSINIDRDDGRTKYQQLGAGLDLLYTFEFDASSGFEPFVLVGGGIQRTEAPAGAYNSLNDFETTNATVDVGLGAHQQMMRNGMGIRFEMRYRLDFFDTPDNSEGHFGDLIGNLGLAIPFGAKDEVAGAEPQPLALDSDGDGVYDDSDRCPGTPPGVAVNADGCPLEPESAPLTPDPDPYGLNLGDVRVFFDFDSAVLTPHGRETLDAIAKLLRERADITIVIRAYADARGTEPYNIALSQRRGKSVERYLNEQGIPASRFRVEAYGERAPIASNATREGRQRNRRAEFEVIEQ